MPSPSVVPRFMALAALAALAFAPTSLRRTDWKRIGFSTWMRSTCQRIAGFQWIASNMPRAAEGVITRSEEHTSELQSLMRISYAVFCLKKKNIKRYIKDHRQQNNVLEINYE